MVNFRAHEVNTGSAAGSRADFEQMIAQLVDVFHPGARQVSANPGDGGIDVFHGRLDDRIVVWQSKYFIPQIAQAHHGQIRKSFASAQKNARAHGYRIDEWILCVPSSMDHPTTLWWDGWRRVQQAETSTKIDIWDETGLRSLLAKPPAAAVLAAYYPPPGGPRPPSPGAELGITVPPADAGAGALTPPRSVDRRPHAGETIRIAGCQCLLYGDPQEWRGGDAWVLRTGAAMVMSTATRPAMFRQVLIRLGSFQVKDTRFLQLWCDDEQTRASPVRRRALEISRRYGISRAELDDSVAAVANLLEVLVPTFDELLDFAAVSGTPAQLRSLEALR
ncbi:hypothetical protein [Frankia sp. EAN1pec]|uniref:hypothetical protein n=1 Tax=Parafrankia sp. (strain EAN1pec) TaxID=298653 RepID=UPI0012FCEC79